MISIVKYDTLCVHKKYGQKFKKCNILYVY